MYMNVLLMRTDNFVFDIFFLRYLFIRFNIFLCIKKLQMILSKNMIGILARCKRIAVVKKF